MAAKSWTLLDTENDIYLSEISLGAADFGPAGKGCKVEKRTLRGGLRDSVEVIRVDNGVFAFEVAPTRGMGVRKAWRAGQEIGWQSPVRGPVHPRFVPLSEPSGLGWLDGFDELLVRCGLESNGAPEFEENGVLKYPLHGRIGNKPAHYTSVSVDDSGEISIAGVVDEVRFLFAKLRLTTTIKTKPGQSGFSIHDEVENLSDNASEMQMLYHINFGLPLLDAGSRFIAPIKTVAPCNARAAEGIEFWDHYEAERAGFEEQVYFLELLSDERGQSQVLLKNAHATGGVSLHFNVKQLPCFTLWKHTAAAADGYVTGLEPGVNFPNPRSYEGEQGRVVKLAPGEKTAFDLHLAAHGSCEEIKQAEDAIKKVQGDIATKVFDAPQKGWCPGQGPS